MRGDSASAASKHKVSVDGLRGLHGSESDPGMARIYLLLMGDVTRLQQDCRLDGDEQSARDRNQ